MNKVLIVGAHPDDEILGVGGTILKHVKAGDEVFVLIMADGESSRREKANIAKRKKELEAVGTLLGIKTIFLKTLPDNEFDSVSLLTITREVEQTIDKVKPNIIYTHFSNDLNIDHRITFQAVLTACRPLSRCPVKSIYSFETLSSTEWQKSDAYNAFCPTFFVEIDDFIEKKIEALRLYNNELRDWPHPRSIKGVKTLAQYRGLQSGYKYAEAFEVVRILK